MPQKLIIGICGHRNSGKDTVCKFLSPILVSWQPGYTFHVGDILAEKLADMTDGNKSFIQDNKDKIPHLRQVLQYLGDLTKQLEGNDIFLKMAQIKYNEMPKGFLIIPSVRLKSEADWVKKHKGLIIRIFRPVTDEVAAEDSHKTEQEINSIPFDFSILNDANLGRLEWYCKCLANDIIKYANRTT